MSEVKRYGPTCDCMSEMAWGDYVRASDYDALRAENERLERERAEQWNLRRDREAERDTNAAVAAELRAELAALKAVQPVAGEREAFEAAYASIHGSISAGELRDLRRGDDYAESTAERLNYSWRIWQARASLPVGVPQVQITGHLDEVDAPLWSFIHAEAQKLERTTGSIDTYNFTRPNGAQPNGCVAVLWNGQTIHAVGLTVRDALNRTQCVRLLAAPAAPAVDLPRDAGEVRALVEALKAADEYLSDNPFNEIGSGSILHRQMKDALATYRAKETE